MTMGKNIVFASQSKGAQRVAKQMSKLTEEERQENFIVLETKRRRNSKDLSVYLLV